MDEFPQEAWTFLDRHVVSLVELGILLALIESGERWWDVPSMAARIGLSHRDTRRVLETFASRNLLAIRISDEVRYQLRPGTPALDRGVDAVADAYTRTPSAVLTRMAARSRGGMTDFADAFRFSGNGRRRR